MQYYWKWAHPVYFTLKKKSHFALGLDDSDLKTPRDIQSSLQSLPITNPATVGVHRHRQPSPMWCMSAMPADGVTGFPKAQSKTPALSVSTALCCFQRSTLSQGVWATLNILFPMHISALISLRLAPARDWAPRWLPGSLVRIALDCPDWKP